MMLESIISNLITAPLLFLIGLIWKSTLYPAILSLWYKDVDISGRWKVVTNPNDGSTAEVFLVQRAHRITGDITWVQNGIATKYSLSGDFLKGILTATYEPTENKIIDRGTITLMPFEGCKILSGCFA